MRPVFDCNVLISALLINNSFPGQALSKAKKSATVLLSNDVFTELIEVLIRPKFDRYVSKEITLLFLEEFKSISTNIEIKDNVKLCRDPKDDMYLNLALSEQADCLITGDQDLLVLNPYKNISIITPFEFLKR